MAEKDYYKILGVSEHPSVDEIKKAYRNLAKKYHPDMNPDNKKAAEEKFKEISEAYYVLGDPKRKQQYDMMRRGGFRGAGPQQGYDPAQGFDYDDLLSHLGFGGGRGGRRTTTRRSSQMDFDQFDDILSQFFSANVGGGGPRVYSMNYGDQDESIDTDVEAIVDIPRSLAEKGGKFDIRLGSGKTFTVNVASKTAAGTKLRLKGLGNPCPHCRKMGDLLLKLRLS
ncbi:MAG: DnaJ domain-containing protein [Candidatus Saganbacteria bacterium]|nr:DnaJ domain-containing protein [Candidatus Saganbacteria bacterium]